MLWLCRQNNPNRTIAKETDPPRDEASENTVVLENVATTATGALDCFAGDVASATVVGDAVVELVGPASAIEDERLLTREVICDSVAAMVKDVAVWALMVMCDESVTVVVEDVTTELSKWLRGGDVGLSRSAK